MNKLQRLIVIIAMIAAPTLAKAQSFNGGLIAGGVISQVNGDGYGGFHQGGFTGGGFINLPFGKWQTSALQIELKYSMFGSHSSATEEANGQNRYNLRLNYIELPVMYQYTLTRLHAGERSLSFITFEVGLSLDYLFNYKDVTDNVQNTHADWLKFSATGNIGVHFNLSRGFGINIRSMNSILPIRVNKNNTNQEVSGKYWDYRNNYFNIVLQATLTYTIGASKYK